MSTLSFKERLTLQQEGTQELVGHLRVIVGAEQAGEFAAKLSRRRGTVEEDQARAECALGYLLGVLGPNECNDVARHMFEAGDRIMNDPRHPQRSGAGRVRKTFHLWGKAIRRHLRSHGYSVPHDDHDPLPPAVSTPGDPLLELLDNRPVPKPAPAPTALEPDLPKAPSDDVLAQLEAQEAERDRQFAIFSLCEERLNQEFDALVASTNHSDFIRLIPYVWEVPGYESEAQRVILSTVTFTRGDKVFDRGCVIDEVRLDGYHPDLTRNPRNNMGLIRSAKIVPDKELRYTRMFRYREGMLFRIFVEERKGPNRHQPIEQLAWYGVCEKGDIRALTHQEYQKRAALLKPQADAAQ